MGTSQQVLQGPQTLDTTLIHRFISLIEPTWLTEYNKTMVGNCKTLFQGCFMWFYNKYMVSDKFDRDDDTKLTDKP
jgi:hypothetical protein